MDGSSAPSTRRQESRHSSAWARLWSWLMAFARWLAAARPLWVALGVLAVALYVSLRSGASEWEIRVAGLALQWLGIGTVAYGVRETRRLFARASLSGLLRQWVSRFPGRPQQITMGTIASGSAAFAPRLDVWSNMDPSAPVEVQLDALRKNVERLYASLSELRGEMDRELR
jgi:hypothetical protein